MNVDVTSLRSSDVVLTLCVCWVTGTVNSQEIVLRNKVLELAHTILVFMTVKQRKHESANAQTSQDIAACIHKVLVSIKT